ncbi:MAG: alpha/beta hydrolase domain-containing protein [Pseudomonadota bacterium]
MRTPGLALLAILALFSAQAMARVVALDVTHTVPAFGGAEFGKTGRYEIVEGVARFEVDPTLPLNAMLVNVQRAPRNARGKVEFDVDVVILKPVDMTRANGRLIYEPVNRGNKLALGMFNTALGSRDLTLAEAAGNGFLMRQGYTVVFAGWQPPYPLSGPVSVGGGSRIPPGPDALRARLPIAHQPDGSAVTALRSEVIAGPVQNGKLIGYLTYPVADARPNGKLSLRDVNGKAVPLPDQTSWRYLDEWRVEITSAGGDLAAVNGVPGAGYELVYTAKDPIVYGLALASMRDLTAFLRYEARDDSGRPNPLAPGGKPAIQKAIAFGASQTGRSIKTLVYHFNEDEKGRIVFDGVHAHISGAALNSQNVEFGSPGQKGGEAFPYTYETLFDPVSRRFDGYLARCQGNHTCPKIIHTDSDAEPVAAGGLVFTDTQGRDMQLPDNVRMYLLSGTQHGPAATTARGMCEQMQNPLDYRPVLRALLLALDEWVTTGRQPPASRYPRRADGTLVNADRSSVGFPAIPGVKFPDAIDRMYLSDASLVPPLHIVDYPALLPRADADGSSMAGVRVPELQVPLATFTGFNARAGGGWCIATGSYIPFATTKAAREQAGDPRPSIEERYPTQAAYLAAVAKAALSLQRDRLLLEEDAQVIRKDAAQQGWPPKPR